MGHLTLISNRLNRIRYWVIFCTQIINLGGCRACMSACVIQAEAALEVYAGAVYGIPLPEIKWKKKIYGFFLLSN